MLEAVLSDSCTRYSASHEAKVDTVDGFQVHSHLKSVGEIQKYTGRVVVSACYFGSLKWVSKSV